MLAVPPGAGKSTLSSFLEYLTSHTTKVNGQEALMVDIKGAPVTFDLERLKDKTEKMLSENNSGWPVYNRLLHNPVEDAVYVDGDQIPKCLRNGLLRP